MAPSITPADISGWLALLPLVIQLIDYIVSVIERLFKASSSTDKKQAAMKFARAVIPPLETGEQVSDEMLSRIIDNQVALNNKAGTFSHARLGVLDPDPVNLYGA
jgi:hypothetical protein